METLFSISGESIGIYLWVTPPRGAATYEEDFKEVKSVPSEPAWVNTKIVSGAVTDLGFSAKEELNDEEIVMLASKSGSFSFWDAEEEDIYTEQDGTPIR